MATRVERYYWLAVREQIIVKMMRANASVSHISSAAGMEWDHTRKMLPCLAERYGIDYQPVKTLTSFDRLGDANRTCRRRMADLLYMLRQHRHHIEIAIATGVKQRDQYRAVNAPFNYDWSWGEMNGVAGLLDVTYGELAIALDEEEHRWCHWLADRAQAQHEAKVLAVA